MQTIHTVETTSGMEPLWELENGFLAEIGEEPMDSARRERLKKAVEEKQIVFFVARDGSRPVGMCSVSPCFSTYACLPCGVFDDFLFCRPTGIRASRGCWPMQPGNGARGRATPA